MNCVPDTGIRVLQSPAACFFALTALLPGLSAWCAEATASSPERVYKLEYRVRPDPAARGAHVALTVKQQDRYLREMHMPLRGGQISDVSGDGGVSLQDGRVIWRPPAEGGDLRWFATISHRRGSDTYDAYISEDWALFRGEDVIPSAYTRTLKGAVSETTLGFKLPAGWSSVTPWFERDEHYRINNSERRFVTPTGWFVLGHLGVRNETIGHVRTRVAGPVGESVRRMDMLALMRWTLPEILRLLPDFPSRLTFVSAGAPMWRGALSAPQSVYVHADRPLISENGTSTMLHETMHVGLGLTGAKGADWIVEGLAEYYGLEVLLRSGTISRDRYMSAHAGLAAWGQESRQLCSRRSTGSNTARAVALLSDLNVEIDKASRGKADLDEVLRELAEHEGRITVEQFRRIAERVAGRTLSTLQEEKLPGCA
ncbi:MAG: hypothetical protein WD448_10830 [Woeseia sp.]